MGRRVKIGIGLLAALLALLALNALWVDGKTEEAEVTVPGGRILDLPDGDLQVAEHGPRKAPPIVLIHCYTCAMDWWDGMLSLLEPGHRIVLVDLLGHGGSEKPSDGYDPPNQAKVVAEALERLGVRNATVVGHSLGGSVTVALSEQSPELVKRAVIIDMPPDNTYDDGHGITAQLGYTPLIGEALWQVKPDAVVRDGLGVAFAPGYDVPDAFIEDLKRITYTAYDDSPSAIDHYIHEESLDQRMKATAKPLMVLIGAEEQLIDDPQRALSQYADGAGAETHLIPGSHRQARPPICRRTRERATIPPAPRFWGSQRYWSPVALPFSKRPIPLCRAISSPAMQGVLQETSGVRGPTYSTNPCSIRRPKSPAG